MALHATRTPHAACTLHTATLAPTHRWRRSLPVWLRPVELWAEQQLRIFETRSPLPDGCLGCMIPAHLPSFFLSYFLLLSSRMCLPLAPSLQQAVCVPLSCCHARVAVAVPASPHPPILTVGPPPWLPGCPAALTGVGGGLRRRQPPAGARHRRQAGARGCQRGGRGGRGAADTGEAGGKRQAAALRAIGFLPTSLAWPGLAWPGLACQLG